MISAVSSSMSIPNSTIPMNGGNRFPKMCARARISRFIIYSENESTAYEAYVSEQNLLSDESGEPVNHPQVAEVFGEFLGASYALPDHYCN